MYGNSHQSCSFKKEFLKISPNSRENTCAGVSFLIKIRAWGLQLYFKRDSNKGVRTPFLQSTSQRLLLFIIYLTVLFCKDVLYLCSNSNLLLLEKSTITILPSFHFENTFYTLYCECIYILDQNINTKNYVSLMR